MSRQPTEQSFLKDVAAHQMTVVSENGVHRHVRFKRPGTYCMQFDLITWPGYLAYSGDMGCFVFARLADMFEFFRSDRKGSELQINTGYWSEKLEAVNKHCGYREFSADLFRESIGRWLDDAEASAELRAEVEDDVLYHADDGQDAAYRAALDFKGKDGYRFTDFWEVNCAEYTYHFVWCCYALAWGIRQYDAACSAPQREAK
ncbi:MAG TPA: hypothetical protein VGL45_09830 [Bradyrhizobium sp.]|jgi:hypothetical protein